MHAECQCASVKNRRFGGINILWTGLITELESIMLGVYLCRFLRRDGSTWNLCRQGFSEWAIFELKECRGWQLHKSRLIFVVLISKEVKVIYWLSAQSPAGISLLRLSFRTLRHVWWPQWGVGILGYCALADCKLCCNDYRSLSELSLFHLRQKEFAYNHDP